MVRQCELALDNIFVERLWRTLKYEDIYLKGYGDMCSLTVGLTEYFGFYNRERPHQSLSNMTPARVYECMRVPRVVEQ